MSLMQEIELHPPPLQSLFPEGTASASLLFELPSHDRPCLVILSHLRLPWAHMPPGLAAGALAFFFLFLDPQNIAVYEWLPSFLQQTPPEYTGEGTGGTWAEGSWWLGSIVGKTVVLVLGGGGGG